MQLTVDDVTWRELQAPHHGRHFIIRRPGLNLPLDRASVHQVSIVIDVSHSVEEKRLVDLKVNNNTKTIPHIDRYCLFTTKIQLFSDQNSTFLSQICPQPLGKRQQNCFYSTVSFLYGQHISERGETIPQGAGHWRIYVDSFSAWPVQLLVWLHSRH